MAEAIQAKLHERIGDEALLLQGSLAVLADSIAAFLHSLNRVIDLIEQIDQRLSRGRSLTRRDDRDGGLKLLTTIFELVAQIRIGDFGHGLLQSKILRWGLACRHPILTWKLPSDP